MRRARERIGERAERSFGSRLESLPQTREQKCTERLAARNGEGIDVIPVECVDWLESANALFRGLEVHCHLDNGGNLSGPDESQTSKWASVLNCHNPPGAEPSAKTLLGYETANYTFVGGEPDNRTRLRLTSATEVLIGAAPVETRTLHNELPFSKSPSHFRLLFMTDETTSDRITRAVLLSAPDESKLDQAVARRGSRPDDFCTTLSIPDMNCTILPKNFGVSPELRVRVNQKDAFVRVGGMVQEVIDLEDPGAGPPPSLKVLRPFQGRLIPIKFDRSSRDILRLVLLPGDQITF